MWFLRGELLFYLAETGSNIKVLSAPESRDVEAVILGGNESDLGVKRLGGSQGPKLTTMENRLLERKATAGAKIASVLIATVPESQMQLVSRAVDRPKLRNISQRFSENTKDQHEHVWDINTSCLLAKPVSHADSPTLTWQCKQLFVPFISPAISLPDASFKFQFFSPLWKNNFAHSVTQQTSLSSNNVRAGLLQNPGKNNFQLPAKINVFLFQSQCPPLPP